MNLKWNMMGYPFNITNWVKQAILMAVIAIASSQVAAAQGSAEVRVLGVPSILDAPSLAEQLNRFDTGMYPIQIVYNAPSNVPAEFRLRFEVLKNNNPFLDVESLPVQYQPGIYVYSNFFDFPEIEFEQGLTQLINSLPQQQRNQLNAGFLPEGEYELNVELIPEDPMSMIITNGDRIYFSVSYGQPPVLFSPGEGITVTQEFPTFTWNPVVAPANAALEYEIRIVELFPGQNPELVIDGDPNPIVEEFLPGISTFQMTPEQLPLEAGSLYAWQVIARDLNEEYTFKNQGRSEIHTFIYMDGSEAEEITELGIIPIVPGFAYLNVETGDSFLEITETADSYILNGPAMLEIQNPTQVSVDLTDFTIQKTGLDNPVIISGTFNGSVQDVELPGTEEAAGLVNFMDLTWRAGEGLSLTGDIQIPGQTPVEAAGTLNYSLAGISGELSAEFPSGFEMGDEPVEMTLETVTARFPQHQLTASGGLKLFGETTDCSIGQFQIGETGISSVFNCSMEQPISLNEGNDLVELRNHTVSGVVTSAWEGSHEYQVSLSSNLALNLFAGPDCSSGIQLGITHEDGVALESFNWSCLTNPSLNLGIGTIYIRNLETPEITYTQEDGWGYRIPANQDLAFQFERRQSDMSDTSQPGQQPGDDGDDSGQLADDPAQPGDDPAQPGDDPAQPDDGQEPGQQPDDSFQDDDTDETTPPEPGREPIRTPADDPTHEPGEDDQSDAISDDGLKFRERNYEKDDLENSQGCISGFFVRPTQLHIPHFTLPWDDFGFAVTDVTFPMELFFDAELRLGCTTVKPRVEIPECLQDVGIRLANAEFSNGQLSATVETTDLTDEGCFTSFGPGFIGGEDYGLKLKQVKGSFGGSVGAQGFQQDAQIEIETALMAGEPFVCGDNQSSTELLTGDLEIRGDGIFTGELSGNIECPLEKDGFSFSLSDATVAFTAGQLGQRAKLTGTVELEYDNGQGQTLTSEGHIAMNLVTGEIEELYLEIEGPYIWRLPEEEPFMEFELSNVVLNREGIFTDAQHSLNVGEESIDVLFNEVQIGFDGRIKSGEVVIMEELSIRGDLDGNNPDAGGGLPVSFSLSDAETTLPETMSTGFLARLGSGMVLDKDGLFLSGSASAGLRFAGFDLPDLKVEFGDDSVPTEDAGMRLAFNSPVITTGQMNLFLNNTRVAWVESGGFFADPNWYEVLIPETLFLPTADIASVTLRRDGELLVDYTVEENRISLSTIPGETLDFEAPILSGVSGVIPEWQVSLNDVILERGTNTLLEGEINAFIPDGSDPVDLTSLGLPLAMRQLSFGIREVDGEMVRKLFVDGQISLFDHIFDQSPEVMFYVNADGHFGGSLNISGLDERISLVDDLDFVQLVINQLEIEMNETPNAGANLMHRLSNLNFDGGFGFFDGENQIAYTSVNAQWLNNGSFEFGTNLETDATAHIELGPVFAGVDNVNHLSVNYQPAAGFTFNLGIDMYMGFILDEESFTIPIPDIHLNQNSLHIAPLELHSSLTDNPLNIPPFEIFGIQLQPDFISLSELEIDWTDWNPSRLLDINPLFDFTLRLPAFENSQQPDLNTLAQTEFSIIEATIEDGLLNGTISTRSFNGGLEIPIGPVQAVLQQAEGVFYAENNVQHFDFGFDAHVYNLPGFDSNGMDCDPSAITLQLIGGSEFSGSVEIDPCGRRELGALALEMGQSTLIFSTGQQNQTAILDGEATLILPPLPGVGIEDSPSATGSIEIDLLNFELLSGSIDVNVPFRYSMPSLENPFLDLQVNQASLDPDGFTISGSSNLLINDTASLDVALNDLRFSFDTFSIIDGSLSIDSAIQINVGLLANDNFWNITVPDVGHADVTPPQSAHFSAVFEGGLNLGMDGITFYGGADGRLNLEGLNVEAEGPSFYSDLNIQVEDNEDGPFRLALNENGGFPPVHMVSGRINLRQGETILAYYENNQLEFMGVNILATLLPDRIPLPNESIAYLDLENSNISEEMVDDNRQLTANGVSLIIDAFGEDNRITATVDNLVVDLDSDYSAITAVHAFDVSFEAPELLDKTGFPLTLTGLDYSTSDGGFQLLMSATLDLPDAMIEHFGLNVDELVINNITLTEGGFQQGMFAIGDYNYDSVTVPLITESISAGVGGEFAVYGVELAIGTANALRFSGYFDMDYMAAGDDRNPLYYNAIWEGTGGNYLWNLEMNLSEQQEIDLGMGTIGVESFGGSITMDSQNSAGELHTWITGAIGFSDLLGSEFSLHAEKLGLKVDNNGVSVGAETITFTGEDDFSFFNEQITGSIGSAELEFEGDVIGISIEGNLTFLETEVVFENLYINTNLDFEIDVSLGDEQTIDIVEDYAWIHTINLFKGEENGEDVLKFTGGVGFNLPDGIAGESGVEEISSELSLTQKSGGAVEAELDVFFEFASIANMDIQNTDGFNSMELGSMFLFEVRGLGVDINLVNPSSSTYYGYAGLYFEEDNGTWDTDKVVNFGDQVQDLPGFSYNAGDQLFTWHAEASGIEVELGVFNMTIDNIATVSSEDLPEYAQNWPVVLDASGSFSFNIANVEGSNNSGGSGAGISFVDFMVGLPPNFDENPIIHWPKLTGVEISIMGIVNVSLGTYDYVVDGVVLMPNDDIPENPEEAPESLEGNFDEIPVNYFLHFKGADDESAALHVSFTGLFSGGVDEIKIYETVEGDRRVFIDNANLSIEGGEGLVSMNLTLNYESSDDRFYIRAGGSASIGPNGFMLSGEFEKDGSDFRMGLFIAGRFNPGIPLIPQAPPVINLTGIGGGIFYRPTIDAIQAIYNSDFLGVDVSNLNDWGMPEISDNITFAVMAYGSFSMLGQGGVYAMEGNMLFALTNEFIQFNASGVLLMQEGNISADLGTGINWSSSEIVIGGEIYAGITYPVLHGSGNIGYTVEVEFGSPVMVDWALWGNYQAWIVGLESSGQFFISPAGLFASMNVTADINLGIAALEGNLDAKVWAVPDLDNPNLGAFASASISATAFGFDFASLQLELAYEQTSNTTNLRGFALATLQAGSFASIEGFILVDMKYELSGLTDDDGFGGLPDITVKAAYSLSPELQALIDDASGQAGDMETAMSETVNFLFQLPDFDVSMSEEELAAAGETVQNINELHNHHSGLALIASAPIGAIISIESGIYDQNQLPEALVWVSSNIFVNPDFPNDDYKKEARDDFEGSLEHLNDHKGEVHQKYQEVQAFAIESLEALAETIQPMGDPTGEEGDLFSYEGLVVNVKSDFTISREATSQFIEESMAGLSELDAEEIYERDIELRKAISSAMANLEFLDAAIEEDLLDHGKRYAATHSDMLRYMGEEVSEHRQYQQKYSELYEALVEQSSQIFDAIEYSWNRVETMSPAECRQFLVETLQENIQVQESFIDCLTVAGEIAIKREGLLQGFAGVNSENGGESLASELTIFRNTLYEYRNENVAPFNHMVNNNFTIEQVRSDMESLINTIFALSSPDEATTEAFENTFEIIETIEEAFKVSAKNFWYGIHEAAFIALRDAYVNAAADYNEAAMDQLGNFKESHLGYSEKMAELFYLKTQLSETLYSLIDAYRIFYLEHKYQIDMFVEDGETEEADESRRENPFADLLQSTRRRGAEQRPPLYSSAVILDFKNELENWLQPPAISSLSGSFQRLTETTPSNTFRDRFISRNTITWNLSGTWDRVGNVELGISDSPNPEPMAVGKSNSFVHYSWLRAGGEEVSPEEFTNDYYVNLRARSRAGIPVMVNGDFSSTVASQFDSFAGYSNLALFSSSGSSPSIMQMAVPSLTNITVLSGARKTDDWQTWYTHNTDELRLELSAIGATVNRFEVRILAHNGLTVMEWQTLSGVRDYAGGITKLTGTIHNPGIEENENPYILQARAVAADGTTTSGIQTRNLVIDTTPPQWYEEEVDNNSGYPWVDNPAQPPSGFLQGIVAQGIQPARTPSVVQVEEVDTRDYRRTIRASDAYDPISGIKEYQLVLNQNSAGSEGMFAGENVETAHVLYFENVDLPSFGTWYMHVRAQNYAGLISDVRTYQILHPDPTPPAAPLVSVQPRNNGLRVFLPQLANDPESGIAGYQYTYRSHDGSAQRDWPEGSGSSPAVDFTHSSLTTLGNSAPYFRIPMLPVSSAFDLQVRAVSGNGTYSQTVSIAGVKFDLRKAEIASIEKELFEREMRGEERKFMNVKVASINGFDAGISSVRLTITDAGGSTLYQNIKRYADQLPYLPRLDDVEFLKIPVHQMLNHGNLNLTVEVETGAGVRSSFEEQIIMNNGGGIVLGS